MTADYIKLEERDINKIKYPKLLDDLVEGDLVLCEFPIHSAKDIISTFGVYSGRKDERVEFIFPADTTKKPIIVGYIIDKDKLIISPTSTLKLEAYEKVNYYSSSNITNDKKYQKRFLMLWEAGLINNDIAFAN